VRPHEVLLKYNKIYTYQKKTISPYAALYYSNLKSYTFHLYKTTIIRLHVSETCSFLDYNNEVLYRDWFFIVMCCINTMRKTYINKIRRVSRNVWNTSIILHVQNIQYLWIEEMSDDITYLMFMVQFKHTSNTLFHVSHL
jgi:hypothetical protein